MNEVPLNKHFSSKLCLTNYHGIPQAKRQYEKVKDSKIQLSERLGYKVTFLHFLNWFDCNVLSNLRSSTNLYKSEQFVKMVFENRHLVGLLQSSTFMFVNFSIFLQAWKNLCYTPLQSHCHIISFSCHMFLGLV